MRPIVPVANAPISDRAPGADDPGGAEDASCAQVELSPSQMNGHERMRVRAAAFQATRVYPGPVGELLARELLCWEEFGYRLGSTGLVMRLVAAIMERADRDAPEVA